MTEKEIIAEKKKQYVEYFRDTPIHKYASMHVGRDIDTTLRWRKEDAEFAEQVEAAHADWIRKNVKDSKAEFKLERLEKDYFAEKKVIEGTLTVADLINEVNNDDTGETTSSETSD